MAGKVLTLHLILIIEKKSTVYIMTKPKEKKKKIEGVF